MAMHSPFRTLLLAPSLILFSLVAAIPVLAQNKPATAPDVLVLSNGDTLHGKFVSEIAGKIVFHSDMLGDITLGWDKIKELHTNQKFAVLADNGKVLNKHAARQIPVGVLQMADQSITLETESSTALPPIPVKNAQFIMDAAELDKQINHEPGFFSAWNGAATGGATLVTATQNQYTLSGSLGLVRTVPAVSWLAPRNRTSVGFAGSYGKITQPAYTSGTTTVPAVVTKSALYHAGAERDQFFSPRFFALGQAAYDHNFAQDLNLQQIYGGGFGWTARKTSNSETDLKGTIQYEKQSFISGSSRNLIGSTFEADYALHTKLFNFSQTLDFIPAYNQMSAYSVSEANTLAFPVYKRLSFSMGTMDSYLNSVPQTLPPTKRNSFQFIMGVSYAIKSRY